jgi:hypothetical protein
VASSRLIERIAIRYGGKHPEKGYKLFSMIVDRVGADAVPDFHGERDDETSMPYATAATRSPQGHTNRTRPAPAHDGNDPFSDEPGR